MKLSNKFFIGVLVTGILSLPLISTPYWAYAIGLEWALLAAQVVATLRENKKS